MTSLFDVLKPKEEQRAIQKPQSGQPTAVYLHVTMGKCKCGQDSVQYQELMVALGSSSKHVLATGIALAEDLPRVKSVSVRNVDACVYCFEPTHERAQLEKHREPDYVELREKYSDPRIKQLLEGAQL